MAYRVLPDAGATRGACTRLAFLRPNLCWSGRMNCEIVMVRGVEDADGYP
jgi:hypothetical protein